MILLNQTTTAVSVAEENACPSSTKKMPPLVPEASRRRRARSRAAVRPAVVAEITTMHDRAPGANRYKAGLAVRRAVLGDPHVDRAELAATDFDRPFQQLITEAAWG